MDKSRKTWSKCDAISAAEIDAFFKELKKIGLREYLIAKYIYVFKQNFNRVLECEYTLSVDEKNADQKIVTIQHPWDFEGTDYTSILADRSLYLLETAPYRVEEYGSTPLFITKEGKCVAPTIVYNKFLKASKLAKIPKVTAVTILATSHILEGK